jgi:hypothetical protein
MKPSSAMFGKKGFSFKNSEKRKKTQDCKKHGDSFAYIPAIAESAIEVAVYQQVLLRLIPFMCVHPWVMS